MSKSSASWPWIVSPPFNLNPNPVGHKARPNPPITAKQRQLRDDIAQSLYELALEACQVLTKQDFKAWCSKIHLKAEEYENQLHRTF